MVIDCPGSEWVVKLGPMTRTNVAGSRRQAEAGALQQIQDAVGEVMPRARDLVALLQRGAVCAGDCGEPSVREVTDKQAVHSYPLPDGKWFSIATSGAFGMMLVCRKGGADE